MLEQLKQLLLNREVAEEEDHKKEDHKKEEEDQLRLKKLQLLKLKKDSKPQKKEEKKEREAENLNTQVNLLKATSNTNAHKPMMKMLAYKLLQISELILLMLSSIPHAQLNSPSNKQSAHSSNLKMLLSIVTTLM